MPTSAATCVLALAMLGLAVPPAPAQDAPKEDRKAAPKDDSDPARRKPTADEEIDELIGPTLAETLTVTGSRSETSVINAPVSISVIGEKQLESSPADNYADLLRGVPGLNISQTSARDINLQARGATGTLETSQLALVDGRSIYQDFFGFVMWDLLPVSFDEVSQVEILRGPASAIWGANALNGVVNVRTKSPRELQGGYFSALGGEQRTFAGKLRWADAPSETFSYKLSASWYEQEAWPRSTTRPDGTPLQVTDQFVNRGTQQPKADLRFDFEPSEGKLWSVKLGGAGTSGMIHSGIGPFRVDPDTWMGYLELDHVRDNFEVKVYTNALHGLGRNVLIPGVTGEPLEFEFDSQLYVAELNGHTLVGEKNLLLWGGDVRLNDFDLSIAPREDSRNEWGIYLEDQVIFSDHVLLNVGARLDHFDTIGSTVSPRTSLIVKPTPEHAIRFAYNRAYRSPSLVNNYLDTAILQAVDLNADMIPDLIFPSAVVGNEDLDEETVDAFEIGYTAELGGRATFTAAVYRNESEDLIDFFTAAHYDTANPPPGWESLFPPGTPVPPCTFPAAFSYRNSGKVRDQGLELGFDIAFNPRWSGTFAYAYQDEPEVTQDAGDSACPAELAPNLPPRHTASAGVRWDLPRSFGSVSVSYTDSAFWADVLNEPFHGATEDYVLVNSAVGLRMFGDRMELVLGVTNLLDEDAQQHAYGDIIGRKVTGELRVRW